MRIVVEEFQELQETQTPRVFVLSQRNQYSTVDELLYALHVDRRIWQAIYVDGRQVDLIDTLDRIPLLEGSVLANTPRSFDWPQGHWQIEIVGGAGTGTIFPLPDGLPIRVGRSPQSDLCLESISVSWSHVILQADSDGVTVIDDDSSNGTFINGHRLDNANGVRLQGSELIGIGGITARIQLRRLAATSVREDTQALATKPQMTGSYTWAFNRPPRHALPSRPLPVVLPRKKDEGPPPKFSWVMIATPLVMAAAMVAVMGSARYALIALLSPVMALGTWFEQKRRAKSTARDNRQNFEAALDKLRKEVADAEKQEQEYWRAKIPDPVSCLFAARNGTPDLWRVRAQDEDFLALQAGIGATPYSVPLASGGTEPREEEITEVLDQAVMRACPIELDLTSGPVGIWGERGEALALARSLICQLATQSGPADVSIGVFTDQARANQWRWTAWLPHLRAGGTNPNNLWLGLTMQNSAAMLRELADHVTDLPTAAFVLVIDSLRLLEGRDNPARMLLNFQPDPHDRHQANCTVSGIIIAERLQDLPAACKSVVHAQVDSVVSVSIPSKNKRNDEIVSAGVCVERAEEWARALARFDDPETRSRGGALPASTHLLALLGLEAECSSQEILKLWRFSRDYRTPLGVSEDGTFWFDLVKDGPHGLVGGTTGSGKSELLRTLVAGLAARMDPQHLTFVLIDFKGGAAFASLDQLPHTIGTLTNLDAHLAHRALKALEAELTYRQEMFVQAGNVDNLDAYMATNPPRPIPRLLLVVDEFAQLAKEYPDVLASLVSIGQVGRTLGVHMILATQRPAGVVNDEVLANTNMRIALRVQSREDSANVISIPDASRIGRDQPGRAYVKLGENDVTPIQTALVTANSQVDAAQHLAAVETLLGQAPPDLAQSATTDDSDMDRLINSITQANMELGLEAPRPVWPEPLPDNIPLALSSTSNEGDAVRHIIAPTEGIREGEQQEDLTRKADTSTLARIITVGVSDDPDHQRQYDTGWNLDEGNLLVISIPGFGATTALKSLALKIASQIHPNDADFLFLSMTDHGLAPLAELAHSIGYAGPGSANRELQERTLRYLAEELERRSAQASALSTTQTEVLHPLFVFVDGLNTLREEYQDFPAADLLSQFERVWAQGNSVGIYCAATTTRIKSIPAAIKDVTTQEWVFQLADSYDYSFVGVARDNTPPPIPGRCVISGTGHHTQIASPSLPLSEVVEQINGQWGVEPKTTVTRFLPALVTPHQMKSCTEVSAHRIRIPVGIAYGNLAEYALEVYDNEHVFIAGPSRCGKSSLLMAMVQKLARDAAQSKTRVMFLAVAPRRSPLWQHTEAFSEIRTPSEVGDLAALIETSPERVVLCIDDADQVADENQALAHFVTTDNPHLLILAAGNNETARSLYGHWLTTMRKKSRVGVLLQPDLQLDGDLLGVKLPRQASTQLSVGRGYAAQSGIATLIQAMTVPEDAPENNGND